MKKTKQKKRRPKSVNALLALVLVLIVAFCLSAFVSQDMVTNRFRTQSLNVQLIESNYDKLTKKEKSSLIPNSCIDKDPKIRNTDETDAFVFLKVTVPVSEITNFDPKADLNDTIPASYSRVETFEFTNHVQSFTAQYEGYYKLEAWGAQGGNAMHGLNLQKEDGDGVIDGGKGGYSSGTVYLQKNQTIYVCVGGQGQSITASERNDEETILGGYNGGGNACVIQKYDYCYFGSGGGATHFALSDGELSSLSDQKENVLLVAGGGGGSYYRYHTSVKDYYTYGLGGCGGGENGCDGQIGASNTGTDYSSYVIPGGTQNDMTAENNNYVRYGSFGKGFDAYLQRTVENTIDDDIQFYDAGGGGGYYGGGKYNHGLTAGGGSGYCNRDYLTNSSAIAGNQSFPDTEGNVETGHSGNGFAKITYINARNQEIFYLKSGDKQPYQTVNSFNDRSNGENDNEYWIELPSCEEGTNLQGDKRTYVFGYNVYLKKDEVTETLFDYIQLKNILQYEISPARNLNIEVKAYGIQADYIEDIQKNNGDEKALMTAEQLTRIYSYVSGQNE